MARRDFPSGEPRDYDSGTVDTYTIFIESSMVEAKGERRSVRVLRLYLCDFVVFFSRYTSKYKLAQQDVSWRVRWKTITFFFLPCCTRETYVHM